MRVFKRIVKKSQAHFLFEKVPNTGTNDQCSYNLPLELKEFLLQNNALVRNTLHSENNLHTVYELVPSWSFKLDESVFEIIGENFESVNNKILFVATTDGNGRSSKFQLFRSYFSATNSPEYEWFVVFYNNNFVGAEITITVDENSSEIVMSNRITSKEPIVEQDDSDLSPDPILEESVLRGGKNEIYYGAPGCGKSYFVKQKYEVSNNIVLRTTFHPEYSNSDFVGQITPKIDEEKNVVYEFNPGIFTMALINAFNHPNSGVILVIEEINRGNASAIFGDVFQLLDRNHSGKSIYSIDNENLVSFINQKIKGSISKIYLPTNLSIVATMNTSDQNISPLDTAFKRRWNLIKIKNVFTKDNDLANLFVPMTDLTWKEFVEKINSYIIDNSEQLNIFGEDKCIGVYFVGKNELSNIPNDETDDGIKANKLFSEKVLFYIWNDIAKLSPLLWFKPEYKTFDSIIDGFEKNGIDIFVGSIFG